MRDPLARLLSINVGLPRDVAWRDRTVRTAIWKSPVSGRRRVRRLNIDGDAQGDLASHGGEHRAVLVYQIASYHYWEEVLGREPFNFGQFGENLTVDGLADDEVCIGDRYRIGTTLFEVTQPRVTCYRVGLRMAEPRMATLLVAHGRPGFYCRVIEEGEVAAADDIERVARDPEGLTVTDTNRLLYSSEHPPDRVARALRVPALSAGWQGSFRALLARGSGGSGNPGLVAETAAVAWTGFRPFRVGASVKETATVVSLHLQAADRAALPRPLPGQFIVLRLRPVPNAAPILRSYSLSGDPAADFYRISAKREPEGVASRYLHEEVEPGALIEASAPRGSFTLGSGEAPVVLVSAGGAGERRHRGHAGHGDAACPRRGRFDPADLVAAWRPRRDRPRLRRRSPKSSGAPAQWRPARPLQADRGPVIVPAATSMPPGG